MKILAASDIHGDISIVRRLANKAEKENVDLVILCGDLTYFDNTPKGLIRLFTEKGKKVMLIPGNHDSNATTEFLSNYYKAINIHGKAKKIKNIGFFGCGLANTGPFFIDEDEIYSKLKHGFNKVKNENKKIMITHVHPARSTIATFSDLVIGSEAVRSAVDSFQPDLLLCGHVHEADGIEEKIGYTRVINVGRKGKIIEVS